MKRIRNIVRYAIFFALNIYIMFVFHSYVNFILLVGMTLVPLLSLFSTWRLSKEIGIAFRLPKESMKKGEEFNIYVELKNPLRLPLVNAYIKIKFSNPFYGEENIITLNVPIRAQKTMEYSYTVMMEYCGRVLVEAESIKLVGLLGIYEVTRKVDAQGECLIYPNGEPRNQEAGQTYMRGVTEAMESKEKGYDFSEVSDIREYIPGDKLQNIHWKLSMKKDELMVKERVSVSAMQLNVLVDLVNDEEMRLEAVLELADSITSSFVLQNLPFTVYYYSVNRAELCSCYIGSEIERHQWLELLLYDSGNVKAGYTEDLFIRQNLNEGTYLYIGYDDGSADENAIFGRQRTAATLRS